MEVFNTRRSWIVQTYETNMQTPQYSQKHPGYIIQNFMIHVNLNHSSKPQKWSNNIHQFKLYV